MARGAEDQHVLVNVDLIQVNSIAIADASRATIGYHVQCPLPDEDAICVLRVHANRLVVIALALRWLTV